MVNPPFNFIRESGDVVNDPAVKNVVVDQTKQWSEMMSRHRREELDLMKTQLQAQQDVLRKLMEQAQAQQMKDLEAIFEREKKEMTSAQTQLSLETARDIKNDKTLKSAAEKERR